MGAVARRASAVAALTLVRVAGANTFCVHDAGELTAALAAASTGGADAASDNAIHLAAATFATTAGPFSYSNGGGHALVIDGGYDAGCSHADPAPGLSALDGGNATQVLNLQTSGTITVRRVTIRNASYNGSAGAGGQVYLAAPGATLLFENNQVIGNATTFAAAGMTVFSTATDAVLATVRGNLFAGNTAPAAAAFSTSLGTGSTLYFVNNTVAGNTNTANGNMIVALGGGNAGGVVSNNVSYANVNGYDYYLYSFETFAFFDNVYHQITGANAPASSGNIDVDPKFVNAGAGNFHLLAGSPAFARGSAQAAGGVPASDLDGARFPARGKVDLGAYDDTVFAFGMELP